MASFARITVLGNLGSDPESKYLPNGATVVSFSLAVNPRKKGQNGEDAPPTWYRVSCWREQGERIEKLVNAGHIAKGRSLYVEGAFEPREFTGNDGATRISYDVTLTDFQFVGGDKQDTQSQQRPQNNVSRPSFGRNEEVPF